MVFGTAKVYFVYHIGPNFKISMIYAFMGCPKSMGFGVVVLGSVDLCGIVFGVLFGVWGC